MKSQFKILITILFCSLFVSIKIYQQNETTPNTIFTNWEKMPTYKYGTNQELMEILYSQIEYPAHKYISGTTVLRITIDTNGLVLNPEIMISVAPEIDAQLLNAIVDCEFIPGEILGENKSVKSKFNMHLPFKIDLE